MFEQAIWNFIKSQPAIYAFLADAMSQVF